MRKGIKELNASCFWLRTNCVDTGYQLTVDFNLTLCMLVVFMRKQAPKTSAIWENHGKHTCDCASEPAPDGPTAAASPWLHGPAVPTETSSKCGRDGNPWPSVLELCASPLAETQKTLRD